MRYILLIMLFLCLVSCGTPPKSEPLPAPISIFAAYPDYLQPSAERVIECAIVQHDLSLFLIPSPAIQSSLPGEILQLQLGGVIPEGSNAYQIGEEGIFFIVNPGNPTAQLSTEQLLAIYTGELLHWDFGDRLLIEFKSYPEKDDLRVFLESSLPAMPRAAVRAEIVSSPGEVLNSVANQIGGFGYLPSSWVTSLTEEMQTQVKVLTLDAEFAEKLTQPVLAIVNGPLIPEVQKLLGCLQHSED